jgi:Rieske Fe-S protein
MTLPGGITRRQLLMTGGIVLDGIAAAILAVPIVRYLLSPITRNRRDGYTSWIPLGNIDTFPPGQTRLAAYRNPVVTPTDGATADIACWVRNVDGKSFQVFAINCAHLGCPVRWFPQSGLFMCPCHGGAYYQDGSRASGPPERGLFQYEYRIASRTLLIKAGEMPTPGHASNIARETQSCA